MIGQSIDPSTNTIQLIPLIKFDGSKKFMLGSPSTIFFSNLTINMAKSCQSRGFSYTDPRTWPLWNVPTAP